MRTITVAFHPAQIHSEQLDHLAHQHRLNRLATNTRYRICVQGVSNWLPSAAGSNDTASTAGSSSTPETTAASSTQSSAHSFYHSSPSAIFEPRPNHTRPTRQPAAGAAAAVGASALHDSTTTRCTEVVTLDTTLPHVGLSLDEHGLMPARGLIHSILTRRLGLIVGCFMGIIVFFVLVSVLGWLKLKKRRLENAKRFHMPMPPPEYTTYRHFSIPHDEQSSVLREGMCNHLPSPAYISGAALGTTTTTSTISC